LGAQPNPESNIGAGAFFSFRLPHLSRPSSLILFCVAYLMTATCVCSAGSTPNPETKPVDELTTQNSPASPSATFSLVAEPEKQRGNGPAADSDGTLDHGAANQALEPGVSASDEKSRTAASSQEKMPGAPTKGSPAAPVTIVEFADFQCPFCAGAESTIHELLKLYPSQVRLVFKDFPLDFHADSMLAHHAALAANEQGKFWDMHDKIFANQRAMKRDDLLRYAKNMGLDMDRFVADMDGGRFKTIIEADQEEGIRLGVNGTPSFFVNGKPLVGARPLADFRRMVEESLGPGGGDRPGPQFDGSKTETDKLFEGLLTKGPANAPVTILWFSDLQSPLSAASAQLLHQVMDAFPGKIRLQFKNFPLEFHFDAPMAHEAALAAGAQGKFWEMQEIIVRNQKSLKGPDLLGFATTLGLDTDKIASALIQRTYRGVVERDMAEGRMRNVRGAPVFFVNGKRIDGVGPIDQFKQAVEEGLKQSKVVAH
jgi:protein-disulfide isomerase